MREMTQADVAAVYDRRAAIPFDGSTSEVEIAGCIAKLTMLAPSREARILDVGCGAGWHLAAMVAAGYRHLYGMDISSFNLRLAAERCAAKVILILGDIGTASMPAFDVVTAFNASFGSFGETGDRRFLDGISRVLAPGGHFLMSYVGPEVASRRIGRFCVRYSRASVVEVVSEVRLSEDQAWLIINQRAGGQMVPEERLRILDPVTVGEMLNRAGIDVAKDANLKQASDPLPFVNTIVGIKQR